MSEPEPQPPDYFTAPPPRRVGVLALLDDGQGRVGLICRGYSDEVARWGLPGGSAAPGELPARAMSRLLAEKLGVRATPRTLAAADHAPARAGRAPEGTNWIYHVPLPGSVPVLLGGGYTALRWVRPDQAGELAVEHELWRITASWAALQGGTVAELLLGSPLPTSPTPAPSLTQEA